MATYRFIGHGITNNNGIATLDYDADGNPLQNSGLVGTGVGEVDVVASLDDPNSISDSSLQSEIYPLWDTILYDIGTSTQHTDNLWVLSNGATISRENGYSEFKENNTTGYIQINSIPNTATIRIDVKMVDGYKTTGFFLLNNGGNELYQNSIESSGVDIGEWATYKITNDGSGNVTVNCLTTNVSYNKSFTTFDNTKTLSFRLRCTSNATKLHFRNLYIYG